jgi:hypothetical protein
MDDNEERIVIDGDEEAEFIQNYLVTNGRGVISTDDIKEVINGQFHFMKAKGFIVEFPDDAS